MVLGANIGSGLLPVVANWQSSKNARIPVTENLMIRMIGVVITYFFVDQLIQQMSAYIATNRYCHVNLSGLNKASTSRILSGQLVGVFAPKTMFV